MPLLQEAGLAHTHNIVSYHGKMKEQILHLGSWVLWRRAKQGPFAPNVAAHEAGLQDRMT